MANSATYIATRVPGASAAVCTSDLAWATAVAIDPVSMARAEGADTPADETRHCLASLEESLARAGLSFSDVVQINLYISELCWHDEVAAAWNQAFAGRPAPAGVFSVMGLAGACRVQMEAIAPRR